MTTEKHDNATQRKISPNNSPSGQAAHSRMGAPRRVRVKGMQGVDVTVVVTVVHDTVWMSISPPFAWEAIMAPGKVNDVIATLELARDEATKVAAARNGSRIP